MSSWYASMQAADPGGGVERRSLEGAPDPLRDDADPEVSESRAGPWPTDATRAEAQSIGPLVPERRLASFPQASERAAGRRRGAVLSGTALLAALLAWAGYPVFHDSARVALSSAELRRVVDEHAAPLLDLTPGLSRTATHDADAVRGAPARLVSRPIRDAHARTAVAQPYAPRATREHRRTVARAAAAEGTTSIAVLDGPSPVPPAPHP